jgi:hypothetical protein
MNQKPLSGSHGTITNGSRFGPSPKSAICTESAVQIVTATHMIPTNFGARASPDSNLSRPVIGTGETGRAGV